MAFNERSVLISNSSVVPSGYINKNLPIFRNMFENRTAVQTNHRMLAYSTYLTTMIASAIAFANRNKLPSSIRLAVLLAALAVNSQVKNVKHRL